MYDSSANNGGCEYISGVGMGQDYWSHVLEGMLGGIGSVAELRRRTIASTLQPHREGLTAAETHVS